MSLESESNKTRLEHLQEKVDRSKKVLKYWEELVTHEVCLINGQHYDNINKKQ